jgi:hypothetical protein
MVEFCNPAEKSSTSLSKLPDYLLRDGTNEHRFGITIDHCDSFSKPSKNVVVKLQSQYRHRMVTGVPKRKIPRCKKN